MVCFERDGQVLGLEGGHIHLAEQALVDEAADLIRTGAQCRQYFRHGARNHLRRASLAQKAPPRRPDVGPSRLARRPSSERAAVIGGADIAAPVTVGAMGAEVFE